MNIEAAATYLRSLREYHGLTQAWVAATIGKSERQFSSLESGVSEPKGRTLAAWVRAVQADAATVMYLLTHEGVTPDQAEQLADDEAKQMARQWASALTEEDLSDALLDALRRRRRSGGSG